MAIASCSTMQSGEHTPFPVEPNWKPYSTNPIVFFDKSNSTYTVTKDFMKNAVLKELFLREIAAWRIENDIE